MKVSTDHQNVRFAADEEVLTVSAAEQCISFHDLLLFVLHLMMMPLLANFQQLEKYLSNIETYFNESSKYMI
jgi:hypothetical protein